MRMHVNAHYLAGQPAYRLMSSPTNGNAIETDARLRVTEPRLYYDAFCRQVRCCMLFPEERIVLICVEADSELARRGDGPRRQRQDQPEIDDWRHRRR
jgi:hypothetical protein